jgi:hypothetical protein
MWLLIFLLAIATTGFALRIVSLRQVPQAVTAALPGQYVLTPEILNAAERSFYLLLTELELPGVRILAKVPLVHLFQVRREPASHRPGDAFNLIAQKHIDFLLVRECDFCPVLGISLFDASNKSPEGSGRDPLLRAIFSDCGLPLVSLSARHAYKPAAIRRMIYDAAPMNFPLSGIAQTLVRALQPSR